MSDFKTELYEADPNTMRWVQAVVQDAQTLGKGNLTVSMSLAIAIMTQLFVTQGGNLAKGEAFGSMVKEGIITMLKSYQDYAKTTHHPMGGKN